MNTPNNAAALLPCPFCGKADVDQWPCDYLDGSGANVIRCAWCHGAAPAKTWNRRATLAQPDALPSQPSGEAVAWIDKNNTTGPGEGKNLVDYYNETIDALPVGTKLYTHPSADAPGVNSSLRVASLALADLAERNTDDLDLWEAAIAAVRNAALAPKPEGGHG